jgi:hypothetical protein
MKWESMPMSLMIGPLALGIAAAVLPYLVEHPDLVEGSLLAPFLLTLMAGVQFAFFPDSGSGRKAEMIAGIWVGMLVAFLPQIAFFVWFVPVILIWLAQSRTIWEQNYPPFRVGMWIGFGLVSGLYIGGILAHNLL